MKLMKGNLFNEKTKRKAYEQKMHRPSSQKVEEEIGMDDKKVMTSLRERRMKRNCRIWKMEQNKQNQEKEDDKNTIASVSNNDEVLMLSNECLHVDEQGVEWILFFNYRVGDFGTVKMRNSSYSKIVEMGDVCFETRCKMILKYVRRYENHFGKGKWKLTKSSLVVAKREAFCNDELYAIKGTSLELWHKRLGHMSEKGLQVLARKIGTLDVCGPMDVETLGGNKMDRTIIERVRCILKIAKLSKAFWGEATQTTYYLINRSPSSPLNFEVLEKAWIGKNVSYSHLRVFG
ncbi:hypothetical protein AAG906_028625 [Vitis piasezkii]